MYTKSTDTSDVPCPPREVAGTGGSAFYTQAQLARRWQVSRRTIDTEVEQGALPVTYIRGSRRFAREHVADYERRNTTTGTRDERRVAVATDTQDPLAIPGRSAR